MDTQSLDKILGATGKILETVPEIYTDALQPTVKETGKAVTLIPRAINAALAPLQKWMLYQEYSVKEVQKILEVKLNNIYPEKIVTPEPYVAVPTLQAISYCMDCNELREMFANLLAKSMNVDTKDKVHPSFTDIIKQLSPLDANILTLFLKKINYPIVNYKVKLKDFTSSISHTNVFLECSNANLDDIAVSLTNLKRLGLIDILYDTYLTQTNLYNKFYEHDIYKSLEEYVIENKEQNPEFQKADIQKGVVEITSLGKNFTDVCLTSF